MQFIQTQCMLCAHRTSRNTCKAFPERIPYMVNSERWIHQRIIKDQTGDFIFTPNLQSKWAIKRKKKIEQVVIENKNSLGVIPKLFLNTLSAKKITLKKGEKAEIDLSMPLLNWMNQFWHIKIFDVRGYPIMNVHFPELQEPFYRKLQEPVFEEIKNLLIKENIENQVTHVKVILYADENHEYQLKTSEQIHQERKEYIHKRKEEKGFEELSEEEIKKKLLEIIHNENKTQPVSDSQIRNMLEEQGAFLNRRKVAQYRQELEILPARLRKVKTN